MASFDTDVDFSQSRGADINVVAWVFTGTAIATVFLKLFARGHVSHNLGWDDFFIFFSLGLSIIAAAFVSYSVTLGLGRHTAAVIAERGLERYVLTAKVADYRIPFPNISIAILITHLLDPNPLRTRCLYAMVTLQVVFAMVSVLSVFLQCNPTKMLWDPSVEGTCWDAAVFDDFMYWVSAYTTITDIVLAVVPVSVFWKLQMRFSTKLGVCIMMSLTLLSAIVTIVKATYLHLFTQRTDPLHDVVTLVIWGLIEQNVVIVAACIPTLRSFFRIAFGTKGSRSGNTSSRTRSGSGFKLSSNPKHSISQRLPSDSEIALHTQHDDIESNSSQRIWWTQELHVESDQEDGLSHMDRDLRNIVPPELRSPDN
ncbi:uncharacterized protein BO80DRAFT_486877 [Aspergillus ibericus CBS 121593]|uniref:Rhodopsin domain-containing protein n=1 Tax=Aspergillus ibericus CBS 121593 TaxID=1448316 RepID=A0A395GJT6_9EURO|nr:hypothetical protein BO80DRAFT_486877 [Aspergillus ibericus CBS 121593]RAK95486.1 hypothetical protein BO80DRAFT_486877 [Aspergillus ibericus CBS 121593]